MQFQCVVQVRPVLVALYEIVLDQRCHHHDETAFLLFDHRPEIALGVGERALSGDVPVHNAGSFDLHLKARRREKERKRGISDR